MKLHLNKTAYPLDDKHYFDDVFSKQLIVLGNTFSMDMDHYVGWSLRQNGKYKSTAPYTIDINGDILEHYDPKYYSNFLNNKEMDKYIIPILIENEGYLVKDVGEDEVYRNYIGRVYNREDEVYVKKWRSNNYWAPYKEEQLTASIELIRHLRNVFNIRGVVMGHNTKYDNIYSIGGVAYRSNYDSLYTDLSPAWDFDLFKKQLEF